MFMYLRKNKKGFTLIELMVVVAIIGILALLGLRLYTGQQEKAKNAIVKANAGTVQTLIQAELADTPALTLASAQDLGLKAKLHNPWKGDACVLADFTTVGPGATVVSGDNGGPFKVQGYDGNNVAIGEPLTAQK